MTYNRMVLSDRSGIFSISIGGFKGIFVEKLLRISEKSKYSKTIFWTISQRQIAYVLSWNITYFCAKFKLCKASRHEVYNRMVLWDRSGIFSISIGGFKGFFLSKNHEESVKNQNFWKNFFERPRSGT